MIYVMYNLTTFVVNVFLSNEKNIYLLNFEV